MRRYDIVVIDGRNFQTKALGARLATYVPGDQVEPRHKCPDNGESSPDRTHRHLNVQADFTFEAVDEATNDLVVVAVRDHRILGLADQADSVHFDEYGRGAGETHLEQEVWSEEVISELQAVIAGTAARWRCDAPRCQHGFHHPPGISHTCDIGNHDKCPGENHAVELERFANGDCGHPDCEFHAGGSIVCRLCRTVVSHR